MKRFAFLALLPLAASAFANELLVVDSGRDRIIKLDPANGSLINDSFIDDQLRFDFPVEAINSGRNTILISDANKDAIYEYSASGQFLRTVVKGPLLDSVRGIAMLNGDIVAGVSGGINAAKIVKVSYDGTTVTPLCDVAAQGAGSLWGVHVRASDILVTDSDTDAIYRFAHNGAFLNKVYDSTGVGDMNFPQGICDDGTDFWVAGFSLPTGVFKFNNTGKIQQWAIDTGTRDLYKLDNGKLLWTAGQEYGEMDITDGSFFNYVDISGASFRFISLMTAATRTSVTGSVDIGAMSPTATYPIGLVAKIDNGTTVQYAPFVLTSENTYEFTTTLTGNLTVKAYQNHWLHRIFTVNVPGSSSVVGPSLTLVNGDVDSSNAITTDDYLVLSNNFDTEVEPGTLGDLDHDSFVTTDDYLILSANFDLSGDEE